jgi:hypothetical protein
MEKSELKKRIAEIDKLIDEKFEGNGKYVIHDGIVDINKYLKSRFKILWVLKEPHDKGGAPNGWDIRDLLKEYSKDENGLNPDMKQTFTPIIYTTYSILNDLAWDEISYINKDHSLIDVLKSIALINIKKLPAGAKSFDNEIEEAYDKYKSIILKQINDYEPDIIICGNTFRFLVSDLTKLYKLKGPEGQDDQTDSHFNDKLLILDVYHPAQISVKQEIYCKGIIVAVNNWIKIKK